MELCEIAGGFLEDRDSLAWSMIYEKADFDEMANVIESGDTLVQILNPVLEKIGYPYKIKSLNSDSFNNLIQF